MPAPETLPSRLIGALFVERGLVSESQIRVALEIQRETGQQLGQVLVDRFGVSRKELASVVAEQWAKLGGSSGPEDTASWRRLGDIFVERGFVTQEELDQALARQRETGERLGEALVAQGVISKFELAGALAEQMAALGDPDADEPASESATVHQLPGRDVMYGDNAPEPENVVELPAVQPVVDEPEPVVPVDGQADPSDAEQAEVEDVQEIGEVVPAGDALEPDVQAAEPVAEDPGHDIVGESPAVVGSVPDEVEEQDEPPATPDTAEIQEHVPAATLFADLREAIPAEASSVDTSMPEVEPEPRAACIAFLPTTEGYRFVSLEMLPEPGATVDVPDVGEYVVLRVGRSPIPSDDRLFAFAEERVAPAVALAVH
jgi:hypothetical protein